MTIPEERTFARICQMVEQIPSGKCATYGQIAALVGNCTARMVGYAMAGLPSGSAVPWQRVINAQGKISPRADGGGSEMQRALLEDEGVRFNAQGKVDWSAVRWQGPDVEWLLAHDFSPTPTYIEDDTSATHQPGLFDG
jgi:methylated-DNA-protein-cysteine methyltransferase-like protein